MIAKFLGKIEGILMKWLEKDLHKKSFG